MKIKEFFTNGFNEIKPLIIIQIIIAILVCLILHTPPNNNLHIHFNLNALNVSVFVILLCSIIDPKKYFNFWTILVTLNFGYWIFWFLFLVLKY